MKKPQILIFGLAFFLAISVFAQAPQQPQQPKPEDVQKNFVLVEKTQPVPERIKAGFDSITARDSIVLLTHISSDLMEGRETATRGYELAAEYAASLFALWKLNPGGSKPQPDRSMMSMMRAGQGRQTAAERSYLQEFDMKEVTDSQTKINLEIRTGALGKSRTFHSGIDFSARLSGSETLTAPVVFAGYGIQEKGIGWDDFKNLDVKGKIVLIISEAPARDNPDSPFNKNKELKDKYFAATPFMRYDRSRFSKSQEISKLGAAAILQVEASVKDADLVSRWAGPRRVSDERPIITEGRRSLTLPGGGRRMPWESSLLITITREMANAILEGSGQKIEDLQKAIDSTLKSASQELAGTRLTIETTSQSALVRCRNVVGYIEGSDPSLKSEAVVIGAHLDHLGKRGDYVFNGADDNGSGSVGVINLARAFTANPEKPKRSVVFCLWTGEEEGLLGSRYYVQNPVFPMEKTVACINLDMISRPYDESTLPRMARMLSLPVENEIFKKIKLSNFWPVSFSSGDGLAEALRNADQYVGLDLYLRESTGGMDRGSGGSDHSSFASANVAWVFGIAPIHDDYHQTSDSVDKANGEMMEKVTRLAYLTVYALADK